LSARWELFPILPFTPEVSPRTGGYSKSRIFTSPCTASMAFVYLRSLGKKLECTSSSKVYCLQICRFGSGRILCAAPHWRSTPEQQQGYCSCGPNLSSCTSEISPAYSRSAMSRRVIMGASLMTQPFFSINDLSELPEKNQYPS
jgi:hypothetical protein